MCCFALAETVALTVFEISAEGTFSPCYRYRQSALLMLSKTPDLFFLVRCTSSAKNEIFGERKGISEMVMKTWLDYLPYTKSDNLTVWNSYFIMCYLWDISANIVFIIYSSITVIFVKLATNDTFFLHISGQNSQILQGKTVLWCNLSSSYSTDIEKRDETLCLRARKTFVDVQQHSKYNSKH